MIYTTQTFYEESFSWCLAHSWGYKAIISLLSCIWNSPQPLCLQKKESETKQARKKKKRKKAQFIAETVAILRVQRKIEKTTSPLISNARNESLGCCPAHFICWWLCCSLQERTGEQQAPTSGCLRMRFGPSQPCNSQVLLGTAAGVTLL